MRHEFKHLLDDQASGYQGFRLMMDSDQFWKLEYRGYMEEINLARELKEFDTGRKIVEEMRTRRKEILGGVIIVTDDVQDVIDKIHSNETTLEQLLEFLFDERGIVRANVLFELPKRKFAADVELRAALVNAATNHHSTFRLMGNVTQRMFSIATLSWLGDSFKDLHGELIEACSLQERGDIEHLVSVVA